MSFAENVANFPSSILSKDPNSNLGKLYRAYAEQLDEIKIALGDLYLINNIKDQSGYNLDRIGQLLNEPRAGMLDERYRLFLTIAIMKRLSRGDIYSINSISSLILEDSLLLREEFDGIPVFFDGTRVFDGSWNFAANTSEPACIVVDFAGKPGELKINPDFVQAINEVRAAGVRAKIEYSYSIIFNDMYLYTSASDKFDGTWKFDGMRKFGVPVKFDIYQIALGNGGLNPDGSLKTQTGSETGLYSEVLRKYSNLEFFAGQKNYYITVHFSELNGQEINEAGIFTNDGVLLAILTFPAITKQSGFQLNFKIRGAN